MKMDLGYIITATRINNKTKDVDTVAIAEDSLTGGYCYWTDNFLLAKKFYSEEAAKSYFNCSFSMFEGAQNDCEIRKPYKVQRVTFELECICNYQLIDNR